MLKADGSVLVHADAGGYKPLNWMTPPTVLEDGGDVLVVRKRAGRSEDRLEIRLHEVLSDVEHEMGEAAALEKDGVERDLQEALAARPKRSRKACASCAASGRPTSARSTSCAATRTTAGSRSRSSASATIDAVEQLDALPRAASASTRPGAAAAASSPRSR